MKMHSESMYRLMVWTMNLEDLFKKPGGKLDAFGIGKGQTVVDYGCGPGRYLAKASGLAGETGKVYAADISPTALKYAKKRIARAGLQNVFAVPIENNAADIEAHRADVIYALDMFHAVEDPVPFFGILRGIVKDGGLLYLEDGHQSREASKAKIAESNLWEIEAEFDTYFRLRPV